MLRNHRLRSEPFSNFDAFLLHIEKPTNLTVITGVMIFDQQVDIDLLKRVIQERLLKFDRFHMRVVGADRLVKSPEWVFDPTFDINSHVHRIGLPGPGDEAALKSLVNDLMGVPLDMSKPPWQFYLVERYGEGSVIIPRIHHSIADGLSLVRVFMSLSDDPSAPPAIAMPQDNHRNGNSRLGRLFLPPLRLTGKALNIAEKVLREGLEVVDNPDHLKDLSKDTAGNAQILGRYLLDDPDPQTVLRGRCGVAKQGTWSEPIPLEQVRALCKSLGGTVNDVLLAAVAGGLRRYLEQRGEELDFLDIRAVVPVNLRNGNGYESLGNQVGMVLVALPVGLQDPLKRYKTVKRRMDWLKESQEPEMIYGLVNSPIFKSRQLEDAVVNIFSGKASLLVTNVRGPEQEISIAGIAARRIIFWVPQLANWGLGLSILSYNGEVILGVAADAGLIPDPEQIVAGFQAELEAMQAWAANIAPVAILE
jgi:diacylglycerol O-acyltransferase / wax synthase